MREISYKVEKADGTIIFTKDYLEAKENGNKILETLLNDVCPTVRPLRTKRERDRDKAAGK